MPWEYGHSWRGKKQNKNPNYSFFSFSCILVFPAAASRVPGVTEKPVVLAFLSPHQPLPERGVVEHPAAIISPQQKRRQLLQAVHKLCPGKRSSGQSACIYDLKQLVEEIRERGDMVDEVQLQYRISRRANTDWNRSTFSGSCLVVCPFLFVLNSTTTLKHSPISLNFNCSLHCRLNAAARKRKRLSFPKIHPARNIVVVSLMSVTYIPTGTHTSWRVYLLVCQWVQRRHSDVEQWQNPLKWWLGGKPHVKLQEVDLCKTHRNHLHTKTQQF